MADEVESNGEMEGATEAPKLSEVETLAYDMGWRPKDQFSGPDDSWRPAAEFIKHGNRRSKDKREIERLRDQSERTANAVGRMMESSLREQADRIKAEYDAAFEKGDKAGAAKAVRELDKLDQSRQEVASGDEPDYAADFAAENPWFGKHRAATGWARDRSQELAGQKVSAEKQLEIIAEEVKTEFPQLFKEDQQQRKGPPAVAAPSRGGDRANAQDFASLPTDAKKACDGLAEAAYMRFGKGADRDKYFADYRTRYAKTYYDEKAA
jgi:hypothetical protein